MDNSSPVPDSAARARLEEAKWEGAYRERCAGLVNHAPQGL